jgi:misacylated tRNA(Ala) deacylase
MTEEIAAFDAYQRSTTAMIREITEDGVVLDRTVFYPRGGGQPGDSGMLISGEGPVPVLDTFKKGGRVIHRIDGGNLTAGMNVEAVIDWDRRHMLMRTHTALHALSAVIWRDFDAKVTGGNMEPGCPSRWISDGKWPRSSTQNWPGISKSTSTYFLVMWRWQTRT